MDLRRRAVPGILLGLGLGGFVDGIVLHQLLQWHHMVTARVDAGTAAGLEENTFADGLFHAATWTLTLVGSIAAVRAWRAGGPGPTARLHAGALLVGWGLFNLLDSANHFLFGLHHIRDDLGGPVSWDVGFLVFALALVAIGAALIRRER